jgi:hypothetical protein
LTSDYTLVIRDDDGFDGIARPLEEYVPRRRGPIAVTVRDYFKSSEGGILRLLFESDLWDSLISFESGIPVELGGALELTFADGVDVATQIGRTLHIFDWTGVSPVGQFTVASPYIWDTSQLYTTGEVTLLAVPEPSCFVLSALTAGSAARWRRRRDGVRRRTAS